MRRLLDLYSCAGGAGYGYHLAGFTVTGVDIRPQPHYPFEFIQADALDVLADHAFLAEFDAIHASPTCQNRARVTAWRGSRDNHPDTLTPTLRLLDTVSIPWVVENVPEAVPPLRPDYRLCGTQFGLTVKRHRVFQRGNWTAFELMPPCQCYKNPRVRPFMHKAERAYADAMGCTWMTKEEARQAVPLAYTEHIGVQLLETLERAA
jgi:DNA (cytosine-5)-methyltransferase 1